DLVVEEIDRGARHAVLGGRPVLDQVGQDLDEVRFTGPEESADPHAIAACGRGLVTVAATAQIDVDEGPEMAVELAGDNVLVEFLPDAGGIRLVGLDDAVDGTPDRLLKNVLDFHCRDAPSICQ